MFKHLAIGTLAAASLAMPAPPALASHATYDCWFHGVAHETVTGGPDTYVAVAYGYIASPTPGEAVSIQCVVEVDNSGVGGSNTGSSTQFATTNGPPFYYTASDTQDVKLCAYWTAGNESGEECFETTNQNLVSQEVLDLLDSVFQTLEDVTRPADPLLCPVLATLRSDIVNGTIVIAEDGDVSVLGNVLVECPPYESSTVVPITQGTVVTGSPF
jgi:hypothetical protein